MGSSCNIFDVGHSNQTDDSIDSQRDWTTMQPSEYPGIAQNKIFRYVVMIQTYGVFRGGFIIVGGLAWMAILKFNFGIVSMDTRGIVTPGKNRISHVAQLHFDAYYRITHVFASIVSSRIRHSSAVADSCRYSPRESPVVVL